MAKTLNFDIFAQAGPSRTSVYSLSHAGEYCGRIIIAWPKDGAGIVKAAIHAWKGPWKELPAMLGQAGGYGYDKASAAVADAMSRHGVESPDLGGRGMSSVITWMETVGYQVVQVL